MDQLDIGDQIRNESRILYDRLASLGYGEEDSRAIVFAQGSLLFATSKLIQCRGGPPEGESDVFVGIVPFGTASPQNLLMHNDLLLPSWEKFADALGSITSKNHRGYIHLMIRQIELENVVANMLTRSLQTVPLKTLMLQRNMLGTDGVKFLVNVLKMNNTLENLMVKNNRIRNGNAISLITTVNEHPTIDTLHLRGCRIGVNQVAMAAIVSALRKLKSISLQRNRIGSHGARMISNCLASNPEIVYLDLRENEIKDSGAIAISQSLKTNTTLRGLQAKENGITQAGVDAFHSVLADQLGGLNALYASNHTCSVDTGEDSLPGINPYLDPKTNRRLKMLNALYPRSVGDNLACLNLVGLPLEIMPNVLCLIQGKGLMTSTYNAFDAMFHVMREWNLPLLYTSQTGPELRRSERIRKRNIMQFMRG